MYPTFSGWSYTLRAITPCSMFRPYPFFILTLAVFAPASVTAAAELPELRLRPQTIDAAIQIGYGLAVTDVDGDAKPDILLADAKQIVWYRNPTWQKFVMAENLTARDNVAIAARDLDGDGRAEVAVGAEWNPGDTVNSGAVFLLDPPADPTQRWTARRLPHVPTTHRMMWFRSGDRRFHLAVLPLHGRGNRNGAGEGVQFLGYEWPWGPASTPEPLMSSLPPLHLAHNFEVLPGGTPQAAETLLVAAKEGLYAVDAPMNRAVPTRVTAINAGEVRAGALAGGSRFAVTIEPMHGNELVVYRAPVTPFSSGADWTARRTVLDDTLIQGHGLATGDVLGTGGDQIVAGWRGGPAGSTFGIRLYAPVDATGETWRMHAVVDDNQMACEDLKLADLDGDGRPEIIAAGRSTKNVVIYWNETAPRRGGADR